MAALTWKNVDAPNLSSTASITGASTDAWAKAMEVMSATLGRAKQSRMDSSTAAALGSLAGADDMASFQEAMKNIDLGAISPEAAQIILSRPGDIAELEGTRLANKNTLQTIAQNAETHAWNLKNSEQDYIFNEQDQRSQMETEGLQRRVIGAEEGRATQTHNQSQEKRAAELAAAPKILEAERLARNGQFDQAKNILSSITDPLAADSVSAAYSSLPGFEKSYQERNDSQENRSANASAETWISDNALKYPDNRELIAAINDSTVLTDKEKDAARRQVSNPEFEARRVESALDGGVTVSPEISEQLIQNKLQRDQISTTVANDEQAIFDADVEKFRGKDVKQVLQEEYGFQPNMFIRTDRTIKKLVEDVNAVRKQDGGPQITEAEAAAAIAREYKNGFVLGSNKENRYIDDEAARSYLLKMTDPKQVDARRKTTIENVALADQLAAAAERVERANANLQYIGKQPNGDVAYFEKWSQELTEAITELNALNARKRTN